MTKLIFSLLLLLTVQVLFYSPCQAQQSAADISNAQARALADTLLRLCEQTAAIRAEVLSQRLELERMSARPWTSRKKLEKMQEKIAVLDKELALKMKNFLEQTSRMTLTGDWRRSFNRPGRSERPEARTGNE